MKIYNFDQGTEEWLNIKLGKFTASNFHIFLGNSQTKENELFKKAAERITSVKCDSDIFTNRHLERGKALELEALNMYEFNTNITINKIGFIEKNKYVGCSPDGLIGSDGLIEIKCKDNHTFLKQCIKKEKGIEAIYKTQIQFALYVTKRDWCDYICYNPNFKIPIYITRIYKDKKYIKKIKEALAECNNKIDDIIKNFHINRNK